MPNSSKARDQTKSDPLVPEVGAGRRVSNPSQQKKKVVTETRSIENDTTLARGVTPLGSETEGRPRLLECED